MLISLENLKPAPPPSRIRLFSMIPSHPCTQGDYDNPDEITYPADGTDDVARIHWGPNFHPGDKASTKASSFDDEDKLNGTSRIFTSPLFCWILGTIAAPLLVVLIVMLTYVTWNASKELPRLADEIGDVFVTLEQESLHPLAKARADFASRVIAPAFRDAHVLNRVCSWLFFGALQKAKSMTSMATATEECKDAQPNDKYAMRLQMEST